MGNNAKLTGIRWRKSSYSGDQGGNCVEIAEIPSPTVAVRDSKNPAGPILKITPAAFSTFLTWTSATTAE
jgi:hypothetical protein